MHPENALSSLRQAKSHKNFVVKIDSLLYGHNVNLSCYWFCITSVALSSHYLLLIINSVLQKTTSKAFWQNENILNALNFCFPYFHKHNICNKLKYFMFIIHTKS